MAKPKGKAVAERPRGRVENLRPWPPGTSGNPKGRPPRRTLSDAYRDLLARAVPNDPAGRCFADLVASAMVKRACQGDINAAREIADRLEGKPRQAVDLDVSVNDWRELAAREGLSEDDVIREARGLINEYLDASGDDAGD